MLYDTLKAINKCLLPLDISLYVVGATARDFAMLLSGESPSKRKTNDLDIAVALPDWEKFDEVSNILLNNGFEKLEPKQKFAYKGDDGNNDYELDLVPFGDVAEDEIIKWRPDGEPLMSVRCFEDIMSVAINVCINKEFVIKIAPIYGQFLIKLDAWLDRRADKDVEDMLYFLKNYYMIAIMQIDEENAIPEIVDEESDPSLFLAGTRWLAFDIAKVLSEPHLEYYIEMINKELSEEGDSLLLNHSMKFLDVSIDESFDLAATLWTQIVHVLELELKDRQ